MTTLLLTTALIITSIIPSSLCASFAAPVDSSIITPSGEKVIGRLQGNEFFHWFEGKNGQFYTLDPSATKYVPYIPTSPAAAAAGLGASSSPKAKHDAIKKELYNTFKKNNKEKGFIHNRPHKH